MILLVGFYRDVAPERTEELVECLRRNVANPHLAEVVVFVEDPAGVDQMASEFAVLRHPKITLIQQGRRVCFQDLFAYANQRLAGHGVIVANADIFFDETLGLLEEESLAGRLLCLARWEPTPDGGWQLFDVPFSQDAWIFEAPLPEFRADILLGKPGCENRLAFEAEKAGLVLSNPSRSVRARHWHRSAVRNYTPHERLRGPVRHVAPTLLESTDGNRAATDPFVADFPSHRGRRQEREAHALRADLEDALRSRFAAALPRRLRRELLLAARQRLARDSGPTEGPWAAVAFRETMGYVLARLEPGVSTHRNDERPLVAIPPAWVGMPFTQVVAQHAAPVEISFMSAGRLLVLASPGWEGYRVAEHFLDQAGWRVPLELLHTRDGTRFVPWLLQAEAGERCVVPTQVMLISERLVRIGESERASRETDFNATAHVA